MLRILLCLCATVLPALAAESPTAADISAGAKTFRSHCAACHGYNAEGGRGPNLAAGVFYRGSTDEDLMRNIANGIPGTEMPGLFYSADRIRQIVAYLHSLNSAHPKVSGDPLKGAALYRSSGCAGCHRIGGIGGRIGPDLTGIGRTRSVDHLRRSLVEPSVDVAQRYWLVSFRDGSGAMQQGFLLNEDTYSVQFLDQRQELRSVEKAGITDYKVEKTSKMPSYKDKLSGADIDNLVAYLASLTPKGAAQ